MEENKQELWNQIRTFYESKFGVEPALVDMMADYDLLRLCATGASITNICEFLSMDERDVVYTIDKYFEFDGWVSSLPFSPLRLYEELEYKDLMHFVDEVAVRYNFTSMSGVEKMYNCARYVSNVEKLLDEKWI